MLSRITVPLVAAAVVFFACGPRPQGPLALVRGTADLGKKSVEAPPPAPGVNSHTAVDTSKGSVRFAIEVSNDTKKRVEVNFPNGHTHEFVVLDSTGREVWRYSDDRVFTQVMQNRLLDAKGAVVFAERWTAPAPGSYTLIAQLNSENYPVRERVKFTLP